MTRQNVTSLQVLGNLSKDLLGELLPKGNETDAPVAANDLHLADALSDVMLKCMGLGS